MKRAMLIILVLLFAISLFPKHAFGGAWTVPKYKVWSEFYMKWESATETYGDDWQRDEKENQARSWDFVFEPKIEVGLTDWLNFLFSLEYKDMNYKEYDPPTTQWRQRPPVSHPFSHDSNGLTSVRIGAKARFLEQPFVLSGLFKAHIYPGYGLDHGDDPEYRHEPKLGYGENIYELRGLAGKTFNFTPFKGISLPGYAGIESGFRWRTRGVSNDVPVFAEIGIWPCKWLLLQTELDTVWCLRRTGSIDSSWGIWRIGPVLQLLGDSALREGKEIINFQLQYGTAVWGRNYDAYQEIVFKVQLQF